MACSLLLFEKLGQYYKNLSKAWTRKTGKSRQFGGLTLTLGFEPSIPTLASTELLSLSTFRTGSYMPTGMTSRPTRALIEFARRLSAK
ncbi:hypothetical protein BU17DRAFT_84306 [Hysterangium stoloniferum]|nr:hypothetical protein BU17DRAFT_84306 [Hysterangium stoloniferum]